MEELRWRVFRRVSWIWLAWERIYVWMHPVTPLRPGALFAFRRIGSTVELHLDGERLRQMRAEPGYATFKVVHQLRDELGALASKIRAGELGQIELIEGTSLMGEAGAVLGFETRPLPRNFANVLQQYFMVGLDALYNPRGLREHAKHRWPVVASMTVDVLEARYGAKSARSTVAR